MKDGTIVIDSIVLYRGRAIGFNEDAIFGIILNLIVVRDLHIRSGVSIKNPILSVAINRISFKRSGSDTFGARVPLTATALRFFEPMTAPMPPLPAVS